jgi:tRNA dimethylallyltransferase
MSITPGAADRRPLLVAVLGPTATGKSTLAIEIARRLDGEVVSCDSMAVYRGFDIGTDKVMPADRRGVDHHMVDVVDPASEYNAADYARDAARAIKAIRARGRLPILAGGTGFYYRAVTRGLFPGPGRDAGLRSRLYRVAGRRGPQALHRMLSRVDPESAGRIQPRDAVRLVRALEVYLLTGKSLTEHFRATVSPLDGWDVFTVALMLPRDESIERISRRVDQQFEGGLLDEVRALLDGGVPRKARPFTGLVYRQALEHLEGIRDERATRDLIVRENWQYARRQLIWFRKEPNLVWVLGAGERAETVASVEKMLVAHEAAGR